MRIKAGNQLSNDVEVIDFGAGASFTTPTGLPTDRHYQLNASGGSQTALPGEIDKYKIDVSKARVFAGEHAADDPDRTDRQRHRRAEPGPRPRRLLRPQTVARRRALPQQRRPVRESVAVGQRR